MRGMPARERQRPLPVLSLRSLFSLFPPLALPRRCAAVLAGAALCAQAGAQATAPCSRDIQVPVALIGMSTTQL